MTVTIKRLQIENSIFWKFMCINKNNGKNKTNFRRLGNGGILGNSKTERRHSQVPEDENLATALEN